MSVFMSVLQGSQFISRLRLSESVSSSITNLHIFHPSIYQYTYEYYSSRKYSTTTHEHNNNNQTLSEFFKITLVSRALSVFVSHPQTNHAKITSCHYWQYCIICLYIQTHHTNSVVCSEAGYIHCRTSELRYLGIIIYSGVNYSVHTYVTGGPTRVQFQNMIRPTERCCKIRLCIL